MAGIGLADGAPFPPPLTAEEKKRMLPDSRFGQRYPVDAWRMREVDVSERLQVESEYLEFGELEGKPQYEWPIAELTQANVIERWGAGTYAVEFYSFDESQGNLRTQRGRSRTLVIDEEKGVRIYKKTPPPPPSTVQTAGVNPAVFLPPTLPLPFATPPTARHVGPAGRFQPRVPPPAAAPPPPAPAPLPSYVQPELSRVAAPMPPPPPPPGADPHAVYIYNEQMRDYQEARQEWKMERERARLQADSDQRIERDRAHSAAMLAQSQQLAQSALAAQQHMAAGMLQQQQAAFTQMMTLNHDHSKAMERLKTDDLHGQIRAAVRDAMPEEKEPPPPPAAPGEPVWVGKLVDLAQKGLENLPQMVELYKHATTAAPASPVAGGIAALAGGAKPAGS